KAIRLAQVRQYRNVLILEDDATFEEEALSRFALAWRELEENSWDMLYLGGRHRTRRKPRYHSPNLIRVRCTYQTHAYAVSQPAYSFILDKIMSSSCEIDVMYADKVQPFHRCFAVFPNVFAQDSVASDITGEVSTCRLQMRPWYLSGFFGPLINLLLNIFCGDDQPQGG
ncbi:MAG: hypothetical protein R2864_12005, partial [Syntrophotaleaceae bacterium]